MPISKEEPHFFVIYLRNFVCKLAEQAAATRERVGADPDGDNGGDEVQRQLLISLGLPTRLQLRTLTEWAVGKLQFSSIDPGTAVGALGAQSIGEPGTQMTLRAWRRPLMSCPLSAPVCPACQSGIALPA